MKFGVFLSDGDIIDGDVKKAVRRSQELEEAGLFSIIERPFLLPHLLASRNLISLNV